MRGGASRAQSTQEVEWRGKVMEVWDRVADWSNGSLGGRVRVAPLFHGVPSKEVAVTILRVGFADLARTDAGWFGAGTYFTPSLLYALGQYAPRDAAGMRWVLLVAVVHGLPFPVIGTDALEGQTIMTPYDSHVTVVSLVNGFRPVPPREWDLDGDAQFVEMAVGQQAHLLPVVALGFARRTAQAVPNVAQLESAALRRKVEHGWALWDGGRRAEAVELWGEAREHPGALCMLLLLGEGGVSQDEVSGFAMLVSEACRGGAPGGLLCKAGMMLERGCDADAAHAAGLYRHGAERARHAGCLLRLGLCYVRGKGVVADVEHGVGMVRQAAGSSGLAKPGGQGLAEAAMELGLLHLRGEGVARSAADARRWLERGANEGCVEAAWELGRLYEAGTGQSRRKLGAAGKWYRLAAERGHAEAVVAMERLARALLAWNAAQRGRGSHHGVEAAMELGQMYEQGEGGVDRDLAEAFRWYQEAGGLGMPAVGRLRELAAVWPDAAGGDADAMVRIGMLYHVGVGYGGGADVEEALRWWRRAADAGDASAMSWLASCLESGVGLLEPTKLGAVRGTSVQLLAGVSSPWASARQRDGAWRRVSLTQWSGGDRVRKTSAIRCQ